MANFRFVPFLLVVGAVLGLFITIRLTQNRLTFQRIFANHSFLVSAHQAALASPSPSPAEEGLPSDEVLSTLHPAAWKNKSELSPVPLSFPAQFIFDATSPPLDARSYIISEPSSEQEARAQFRSQFLSRQRAAAAERRLAVNSARLNAVASFDAATCGQKMNQGLYWRYREHTCASIEGFRAPLRSYEVGVDELSCSAAESRRNWLVSPFENITTISQIESVIATVVRLSPRFLGVPSGRRRSEIEKQYGRYVFYSSWLFKQYRPWRPMPVATSHLLRLFAENTSSAAASSLSTPSDPQPPPPRPLPPTSVTFRTSVDSNTEKLLRLENFCMSPIGGYMSGHGPDARHQARAWMNDDTRGAHNEAPYREFFNKVRTRLEPPRFLDERPVVFFPAMYLSSHNMAHSHFKFWSLLGLLKLDPFSSDLLSGKAPPARSADSQPDPGAPPMAQAEDETSNETAPTTPGQLKPLIVFVLRFDHKEKARARAFGFMYQMLDLPWAVQLADPHEDDAVEGMMRRAKHGVPTSLGTGWVRRKVASKMWTRTVRTCRNETVPETKTSTALGLIYKKEKVLVVKEICEDKGLTEYSKDAAEPDEMCFRRGIAWQNCFHTDCVAFIGGDRPESFNFYNYQPINTWRRWMMSRYESLLTRCLPVVIHKGVVSPPSESLSPSSSSSSSFRRPKVFFNIRTATRAVWFTNLLMDWLRRELVDGGFASDVIFRELWQGSRAQYLDDVRTSDIFAGVHGGSFAITMLLRPKPVVIEYAGSWSFCSHQGPPGPYCWFDVESQYKDASHWVYEFPFSMWDQIFRLGSFAVIDSIKEGSCRWYMQQYGAGVMNASTRATAALAKLYNSSSSSSSSSSARGAPLFSGTKDKAARQAEESLDERIPAYCRGEYVKYSDMKKLHVQVGERADIDAREAQHLLQRFFKLEVTYASAAALLRLLSPVGGKLSWYFESEAFDIFTLLIAHFVDARINVHNRTNRVAVLRERPMSIKFAPHRGFEYPLERVACIRAVSRFFVPGVASAVKSNSTAAAAAAGTQQLLSSFIPDDYDPGADDTADTSCLFVAKIGPQAPPPNAPTLVAPLPTTVAPPPVTLINESSSSNSSRMRRNSTRRARRAKRVAVAVVQKNASRERAGERARGIVIGLSIAVFVGGLVLFFIIKAHENEDDAFVSTRSSRAAKRRIATEAQEAAERKELVVSEKTNLSRKDANEPVV